MSLKGKAVLHSVYFLSEFFCLLVFLENSVFIPAAFLCVFVLFDINKNFQS